MKTTEFKNRIKNLGFKVVETNSCFNIEGRYGIVALVSRFNQFEMRTTFREFTDLGYDINKEILDVLYEYSSTPIKNRRLIERSEDCGL
ncbi:hypothetical protein ETI06_05770 [Macrococcoides goetzii]|nr:hypothetical protein [Macrococcus goetzii]TDM49981.1 hypothetical protein ETI06_05770 [Macrococcus goetzii]